MVVWLLLALAHGGDDASDEGGVFGLDPGWERSRPTNPRIYVDALLGPFLVHNAAGVALNVEVRHGWVALSAGIGGTAIVGLVDTGPFQVGWATGHALAARGQIHLFLGSDSASELAMGLGPVLQRGELLKEGLVAMPSLYVGRRFEAPSSNALFRCGFSIGLGSGGFSCGVGLKPRTPPHRETPCCS